MPFEKVDTQVDFPAQERAVLRFWDDIRAFDRLRAKNANGPRWSFLDGPITANNPMGVHHAWGRTYKDAYQRFHAMLGCHQRYQNGFDCQGLWVEVEVEKELGLKTKREIELLVPGDPAASIDVFVRACKARVDRFARIQTEQSIRLGYWMDWDRTDEDWAKPPGERKSYFTLSDENNYTIWHFLKKCHQRGMIYRGSDVMPWSGRGGSAYSQMEVAEGRRLTVHAAPFVRFPLKGRDKEYLLVWTTTPWTLTSNVAAAVNPQLEYVKIRATKDGSAYWFAKENLDYPRLGKEFKEGFGKPEWSWPKSVGKLKPLAQIFKEQGGYTVEETKPGSALVGLEYVGPFDDLPAQQSMGGWPSDAERLDRNAVQCHRVIDGGRDSEGKPNVVAGEGTGIVHIAPGCGDIDHKLGKTHHLVDIAPLDDEAKFLPGFGVFTGLDATERSTAEKVFEELKRAGFLVAVEEYPHVYPHCWRTGVELVFRPVDEWFIKMDWRGEIMKTLDEITFLPAEINGKAREMDWLRNMGDWMISKKRYWGLALPIWVDAESGDFEVMGSHEELKARAVEGWEQFEGHTPHRPWIDLVKIRNPKTGNLMNRIPDVGNPWLDAGIVPYSTMGYNRDRAEWAKWFPADLITECFPGQFRNWFYAILAMSAMLEGRAPFKTLLGHALVRDQSGKEMHKSLGNSIEFNGAADSGYELFTPRDPKLTPEAQAKKPADKGGLPADFVSIYEGEALVEGKPAKVLRGKYEAIGADVIRWMYCRQNPAVNLNVGPGPADEVRARFHLKLLNSYAFFCNYARLDEFDPAATAIPVAERPAIDRWILADLQKLITTSRAAFEGYDLQAFCLEAERFVDDRLSNWYIRRNRPRFQKHERDADKTAAYQTLYAVLVTLTKLCAPIVPFFSETMYQNLVVKSMGGTVPMSVHHCDYPIEDASLLDKQLSADMEAVQRLVTLGSAARNAVKIKVRQPLAELRVRPGNDADRRAVEHFAETIREELNVKRVSLHEAGELLAASFRPNARTFNQKFAARIADAQATLEATPSADLTRLTQARTPFTLGEFTYDPADILVTYTAPEGWSGIADGATQVALDSHITPELAREGMARDIIRQINDLRKAAGLNMEDRITLLLATEDATLRQAIEEHRDYIAGETLAIAWATTPGGKTAVGKVEGKELTVGVEKVG